MARTGSSRVVPTALVVALAVSCAGVAGADELDLVELLGEVEARCAGREGVEDCDPAVFGATFGLSASWVAVHRTELVVAWRAELAGGSHVPAYGLAFLGAREALPALRARLLAERYAYGWEPGEAPSGARPFRTEEFPRHAALARAIEVLDGRAVAEAVRATPEECLALAHERAPEAIDAARWLSAMLCR